MKNSEKNNKKIIIEENKNQGENAASVEIKRKRGRPKKNDNNNLIQLKNKKNNNKKINNAESIENKGLEGDKKINKNNKKNNLIAKKNSDIIPDNQDDNKGITKHRGRPKGSTNTIKTSRPDRSVQGMVTDDKRQAILRFNMVLYKLPKVNKDNPDDIQERTDMFFELCNEYNLSPTVAAYAMSLGIDRITLWTWITNKTDVIKNKECLNILKNAYTFINAQYENMLTEGKIVPVSAFFLMQNNHGYKQQTDHVITANTPDNVTDDDIMNKAGLIE